MKPVFLDTGYIIALESSDDQNHRKAKQHWQGFSRRLPPLVTSSFILAEAVTFFNSKGRHAKAVKIGDMLLESPTVTLVYLDELLLLSAWDYFQLHTDKTFSLADCVSFVVMRERRIQQALSFDHHLDFRSSLILNDEPQG